MPGLPATSSAKLKLENVNGKGRLVINKVLLCYQPVKKKHPSGSTE
jgi:hypothetical protein